MYNNVQQAVKSNQSRIKVGSVYTTNKPLQSSFGSVLRPPFLGGFGPHLSFIIMFPPAQTNCTKDENKPELDSIKLYNRWKKATMDYIFQFKLKFVLL